MGRLKGTKLTKEQKEKMALKRMSKNKKLEQEINVKKSRDKNIIAGYGFSENDDHPMPIFFSEIGKFKGKMYKTLDRACRKFEEMEGLK
jgi:hypothetical protein